MKRVSVVQAGLGNVGRAFTSLLAERSDLCRERYGLDLRLKAILRSRGGFFNGGGLAPNAVIRNGIPADERHPDWKPGLDLERALASLEPGVFVDCTPSGLKTGEPGLGYLRTAFRLGWNAAVAGKGALAVAFRELTQSAIGKGLALKFSAAAGAALPALDVGLFSLAGTRILGLEGILNGTTNYILTRMGEGLDYVRALGEAQAKGIAEPDPGQDVGGWDTATKLLLIGNAVLGTSFNLDEIPVRGIEDLEQEAVAKAAGEGKALKLLGSMARRDEKSPWRILVEPRAVNRDHPLFSVRGTDKGVVYFTDTMGSVAVAGGKSDPRGAAAALLKDIINIYSGTGTRFQ